MSSRPRTRALLLTVAVAAPLTLAACSRDSEAKTVPVKADSSAVAGGTLRVGIVRPTTIDPQLLPSGDTAGALVVRTMCDPLIGTDPVTRELSPAVARAWRVLGPGGVQVAVRKGLKFNDGSAVTARDVAASLRRVIDPDVVSPQSKVLSRIAGWQDVQDGKTDLSRVSIKSTSDDAVQLGLISDDSQFVYALAQPFATPVSETAARKPGFAAHPVCVGPYRVKGDYTGTESSITLTRVADYAGLRPALSRGGRGWADTVVFTIYDDRSAMLKALKDGTLDAAQLGSGQLASARTARIAVASVTTPRLEYVGLPNKEPLNNPLVQAALSRLLDRERINQLAFGGSREPAYNLIPPTLPDSVLPDANLRTCGISPHGNPREARQLLEQAKQTGSLTGDVVGVGGAGAVIPTQGGSTAPTASATATGVPTPTSGATSSPAASPTPSGTATSVSPEVSVASARALAAPKNAPLNASFPFYFNAEFDNAKLATAVSRDWLGSGLVLDPAPVTFAQLISRGEGTGGFDGVFRMAYTADYADQGQFVLPLVSIEGLGRTNYTGFNGELIARQIRNKLAGAVPPEDQKTNSLAVARATCAVPVIPIAWYRIHLGLKSSVVIAAHGAVDRGLGLPELRELAVG